MEEQCGLECGFRRCTTRMDDMYILKKGVKVDIYELLSDQNQIQP
jgi:hypothetical protein